MRRGTEGSGLMSYSILESDIILALAPDRWRSNLRSGLRLRRIVQHCVETGERNTHSAFVLFVGLTP